MYYWTLVRQNKTFEISGFTTLGTCDVHFTLFLHFFFLQIKQLID